MTKAASIAPRASKRSIVAWQNPSRQILAVDILAVLTAVSLPWSTSAVGLLIVLWLLALVPTLNARAHLRFLNRPSCLLPLCFFALAVVGTLWADAPWPARLHGISPVAKLLVIPALLYHFERSERGAWVFVAFLVSCSLLMVLSWIVLFAPALKLTATVSDGVPVKNYIDQSQEFALCMVALAPFVMSLYSQKRFALSGACALLILGFLANLAFVASARSALVYLPVLLFLYAFMHLNRRASALLFVGTVVAATIIWSTSSYLRGRITAIATEYHYYQQNIPLSTGLRLEYWQKSLKFFADAPILGNGTGSTRQLFERDAIGQTGLSAEVVGNPHNQTLYVAVQWGLVGVALLYAMWLAHLYLFRGHGLANWVGLLVVAQNIASSLLNSHLFDFHEGWMYVLGVGVAGGMSFKQRDIAASEDGPLPGEAPVSPEAGAAKRNFQDDQIGST
jgi:O-antigen ligase